MTDTIDTQDDDNVTLTKDEYNTLLKGQREGIAVQAGMDLSNPTSELVLSQHWTPESTVADMEALVEKYNVGVVKEETEDETIPPGPEAKVEEKGGPEGVAAAGDIRSMLSGGTSVPGQTIQLDPAREAKAAYDKAVESGLTREDARVAGMDTMFKATGNVHAMARIHERQQDEEKVSSILASQEAASGVGNV